ncbi:5464_t:CDS:2 [Diversispora eburnea]|uniref:5464_t:CDS:1 n=1 Tax=Diversispora eburnea TaxID=1213867 RepID=A0A9N8VIF0_9GLOM|nr:5464_t:CDS:2 [Diversispora eburnea]
MSAQQSPEDNQLELIENKLPIIKWFDDLTNLLNLLEYTRDSNNSIIQNRETINSEIWLKISKFVENYDVKELNFNTLSLDPSFLFKFASKTPLYIDNELKTKAFSSSPLILENSVKYLQSSSKQKLFNKYTEETEETPIVSVLSTSKSSETKRKSEKPLSKSNKRTKKYAKRSEIEGTSIMTYPVKDNSHTTLIWKCKKTNDDSQIQTQQQQYMPTNDYPWTNNTSSFSISPQHNVNYRQQEIFTIQEIPTIPNFQQVTIPNIQEIPTIPNFQDHNFFYNASFPGTNLSNTTTEVDNLEENLTINSRIENPNIGNIEIRHLLNSDQLFISEEHASKPKESFNTDIKSFSNENELESVSKHNYGNDTQYNLHEITEMPSTIKVNLSSEKLVNDNICQPIESFFLTNEDQKNFLKNQADININDSFNCIKFNKPQIKINNEANIWSESFGSNISNFISIESNVYFGTSSASHAKVEKLIKLLINKKNEIDKILESQPAFIIAPDFQKSSSMPNISYRTSERLDKSILKKLEELFDDEYEIVVIPIDEEIVAKSSNAFQDFNISAYLQAKVYPLHDKRNNLEFSIDVNNCGMGPMLSENWPSLRKLGSGYFLDSVEIKVVPISNTSMSDNPKYKIKDGPWPQQPNRAIYMSEINENSRGIGINTSFSSDPGIGLNHVRRNEQGFNFIKKEWERTVTYGCETGLCWKYQYTADSFQKNLNYRSCFAPGKHSCHWETLDAMSGFRITIIQALRCDITDGWRRKLKPNIKSKLMKLCPKMAHTLEISFNSFENFNENFKNLKNYQKFHEDRLKVTVAKNASPQIENQKIQTLEISTLSVQLKCLISNDKC